MSKISKYNSVLAILAAGLLSLPGWAQPCSPNNNQVEILTTVPQSGMNVCGTAQTFEVSITNNNESETVTDPVVTVNFPTGIQYAGGVTVGSTASIAGDASLIVDLTGQVIAPGQVLTFTYTAFANCTVIPGLPQNSTVNNTTSVNYILSGTTTTCSLEPSGSSSYNILYADLTLSTVNTNMNGYNGQILARTIKINNGGTGSATNTKFRLNYASGGLTFQSLQIVGGGALTPVWISATEAEFIIPDIAAGQEIELTEMLKLSNCNFTTPTEYKVEWGCAPLAGLPAVCNETDNDAVTNAYINLMEGNPYITIGINKLSTPITDFCNNTGVYEITFTNTGANGATFDVQDAVNNFTYNLNRSIYSGVTVDFNSIEVYNYTTNSYTGFSFYIHGAPLRNNLVNNGYNPADYGLADVDNNGLVNDLPDNGMVKVRVEYIVYTDQLCTYGYGVPFYLQPTVYYTDLCTRYYRYAADEARFGIAGGALNFITVPTDLEAGVAGSVSLQQSDFSIVDRYNLLNCTSPEFSILITVPDQHTIVGNQVTIAGITHSVAFLGTNQYEVITTNINGKLDFNLIFQENTIPCEFRNLLIQYRLRCGTCTSGCNAIQVASIGAEMKSHDLDFCYPPTDCNVRTTGMEIQRQTFGKAYTGTAGVLTAADYAALSPVNTSTVGIAKDRVYPCDKIKVRVYGKAVGCDGSGSINNIDLDVSFDNIGAQYGQVLNHVSLGFTTGNINFSSGNIATSSPPLIPTIVTTSSSVKFHYDNINPFLIPIPSGTEFTVELEFEILPPASQLGDNIELPHFRSRFSGTSSASGNYNSLEDWGARLRVLYLAKSNQAILGTIGQCQRLYGQHFSITGGMGGDDFPNEFRPVFTRTSITETFPNWVNDDVQNIREVYWDPITGFQVYPLGTVGTTSANTTSYQHDNTWTLLDKNSFFEFAEVSHVYSVDCGVNIAASAQPAPSFQYNYSFLPCTQGDIWNHPNQNATAIVPPSYYNYNVPAPTLNLTATQISDAVSSEVSWDVFVNNSSGNYSSNTWLSVEPQNTNVGQITNIRADYISSSGIEVPLVVTTYTTGIAPNQRTNWIIQASGVGSGQTSRIRVYAQYANCVENRIDSLLINAGWDCSAYPASRAAASCPLGASLTLKLRYKKANLQMLVSTPNTPATPSPLCSAVPFTIDLTATKLGFMNNMVLEMQLPPHVGLVTANTIGYTYNSANGTLNSPVNCGTPTPVACTGCTTICWDLSQVSGLPGGELPGINNALPNLLKLNFDLFTECGFDPGIPVRFVLRSRTNCNDPVLLTFSQKIRIQGFPPLEQYNLSVASINVNAGATTTANVILTNTGTVTSGGAGTITVTLPAGYTANAGSGYTVVSANQVSFAIPAAIYPGQNRVFSFSLTHTNASLAQPCGDPSVITANAIQTGFVLCQTTTEMCFTPATVGSGSGTIRVSGPTVNLLTANVACDDQACTSGGLCGQIQTQVTGGSGNYTYNWSVLAGTPTGIIPAGQNDDANINPAVAGSYQLVFTDNGYPLCPPITRTANITPPPVFVSVANLITCNTERTVTTVATASIILAPLSAPSAGFTFVWYQNTGAGFVSIGTGTQANPNQSSFVLSPGIYRVEVLNTTYHCTAFTEFTVIEGVPLLVNTTVTAPVCANGTDGTATALATGGVPPVQYNWVNTANNSVVGNLAVAAGLSAGNYTLTVSDNGGCVVSATATINNPTPVTVNVSSSSTECVATATIAGGTAPYNVVWLQSVTVNGFTSTNIAFTDPASTGTSVATNLSNGNYTVYVQDVAGCVNNSTTHTINVTAVQRNFQICFRFTDIPPVTNPTDTCIGCVPPPVTPIQAGVIDIVKTIQSQVAKCVEDQQNGVDWAINQASINGDLLNDRLEISSPVHLQHFTLYYYDRGGNLVRTVPPKGVDLSSTTRADHPSHTYVTGYDYSSLQELRSQHTPDAGNASFTYNSNRQLRFSQNAQQFVDGTFSYTKYDNLSRIVEVGQEKLADVGKSTFDDLSVADADNATFPATAGAEEITFTTYSTPAAGINYGGNPQRFLENRVSYVSTSEGVATYYSYDVHGNVEWLVQYIPGLGNNYIRYEYDLISNKVLKAAYNEFRDDRFYHRYEYDEDNRLTEVYTSPDEIIWERDSKITYYAHGPLQRTEIGEDKIQGIDYTYTIQGWLKSINDPDNSLTASNIDPDRQAGMYEQDAFAMTLGYYNGDYINANNTVASTTSYSDATHDLFNGNISAWSYTYNHRIPTSAFNDSRNGQTQGNIYTYDKLNRIVSSEYNEQSGQTWAAGSGLATSYSYDPNGNITTLGREDAVGNTFDQLSYVLDDANNTNKLLSVTENSTATQNGTLQDITNQGANNYEYDGIGNLVKDTQEEIAVIDWTVYGKIRSITRVAGSQKPDMRFVYDGTGNRICKILMPKENNSGTWQLTNEMQWTYTFYVRDASGNVLSILERTHIPNTIDPTLTDAVFKTQEQSLYGSDRLGVHTPLNPELTRVTFDMNEVSNPLSVDIPDNILIRSTEDKHLLATASKEVAYGANGEETYLVTAIKETDKTTGAYPTANAITFAGEAIGAIAIAENTAGEAQFYAVAGEYYGNANTLLLYDKNWNLMPGLANFAAIEVSVKCKPIIIRNPANTADYYLFTVNTTGQLYYHVVNINLQGNASIGSPALGDLSSVNNLLGDNNSNDMTAYEDRRQGKANILYTSRYNSSNSTQEMISYRFQADGIIDGPIVYDAITQTAADPDGEQQLSPDGSSITAYIAAGLPIGWTLFRPVSTYSWELDNLVHLPTARKGTAQPLAYPAGPEASLDITTTNTTVYMSHGTHIQVPNPTDASQLTDNYLSYMPADMNSNPIALYALRGDIRRDWQHSNTLSIGTEQNNQWTQLNAGNITTTLDASGGDAAFTFTGQVSVQHHILDIIRRDELIVDREVASRTYELKDHLANVRAVVSARKGFELGTLSNYAEVVSINDYYPFGMLVGSRSYSSTTYRYGFNGQAKDDEIAGSGNFYTAEYWQYDSRLGKRWNVDPVIKHWMSPYHVFSNNPVAKIDPNGANDDWVEDADGNIKWDKDANSEATTKKGEKYLGKTLTFKFNSYIDKKLWDGPMGNLPAGDKLTSTIKITGNENSEGELTSISATKEVKVGETPVGQARNYYPGLGTGQNKFSLTTTSTGDINLNFEQHASVSPSEEFGMKLMGYNIVNVAQKLNINYSQGKLTISSATDIFPSATLTMNGSMLMQYNQPSFKATHSFPIKGWTSPSPYKDNLGPQPIYDYSYKPAMWYKR